MSVRFRPKADIFPSGADVSYKTPQHAGLMKEKSRLRQASRAVGENYNLTTGHQIDGFLVLRYLRECFASTDRDRYSHFTATTLRVTKTRRAFAISIKIVNDTVRSSRTNPQAHYLMPVHP